MNDVSETDISKEIKISEVRINNFKCYKGENIFPLNDSVNIFVGNNASGKSTILEAIHLALTGVFQGRFVKYDISQYLFNKDVVEEYLQSVRDKNPIAPPSVLIEIFLKGEGLEEFSGNGNLSKTDATGLWFKICFDEKFQAEYEETIKNEDLDSIPIEYYDVVWESFAREIITPRSIPLKSALIDSASSKNINGSDLYISKILKDILDHKDIVDVSQAHRKLRETFSKNSSIISINEKIKRSANMPAKNVSLAVDLSIRNSWESTLITYIDEIPFHFAGKGEQSIVKTKLALGHKKSLEANVIILEEPENHLSHSALNELLNDIETDNSTKQIIISTHSSFVANKLGLQNIALLHSGNVKLIKDLEPSTNEFFEKIAGYDTLRLVLAKKAILVEGDSDELIVQKAYMQTHGKLPIQDGVEVISVGTSFLRFIEIAAALKIPTAIVTDNDGDPDAVDAKFSEFINADNPYPFLKLCIDRTIDSGDLKIGDKPFNYNTLEPKILKSLGRENINKILGKSFANDDAALIYMRSNKTNTSLSLFKYSDPLNLPAYITEAIE